MAHSIPPLPMPRIAYPPPLCKTAVLKQGCESVGSRSRHASNAPPTCNHSGFILASFKHIEVPMSTSLSLTPARKPFAPLVASGLGVDVASWAFWQVPGNAKALAAPVWEDITSVMDIGIILGALLAAGLAGRFAPSLKIPARSLIAAVIGGLLLGYGSRLAYGCNIGAYFSGIASGSLHGWLWLVAAFIGNSVGVRLRPFFFAGERPQIALSGC
ncbi:YeeE/YedE thiosulfate transporter family protein [Pseudomonas sp. R4-34-07]|uniref:YeeE/YedE thiosulfate transporter family protein n=1 Tax=Pseudomonas sp. R4-34-07 TaxID=658642 RepID=UPI003556B4FB